MTQRVGGLPPTAPMGKFGWIIGIASAIVLGLIVVAGIAAWIFGGASNPTPPVNAGPLVFQVNPRGGNNASTSLAEVLARLRGKNKPARIIVQDDLAESDVLVNVPNVVIEAEEGKTIHWRPSPKEGATKLFAVYKAEGVRIKGFTLDGDNRIDILVNLFHRCPGTKLEDLKLQGFRKYGIWVTNCEGGESQDRRVQFNRLEFVTIRPEQTALFFSIEPGIRDAIPKNRYFAFHDCTFVGPGTKVKTPDLASVAHIDWPADVKPVPAGSAGGK